MLLYSHDLYAVVAIGYHAWQHVLTKLIVCAHTFTILRHAYMTLINEQRRLTWAELLFLPYIWLAGVPYLCREYLCLLILHYTGSPCRNTLARPSFPVDVHLIQVAMFHGFFAEFQLPVACPWNTLGLISFLFLPAIEVAYEEYACGIWGPLSEHPPTGFLVQTIIIVAIGEVGQCTLAITRKLIQFPQRMVVPACYRTLKRLKIRVVLHYTYMFGFHRLLCLV